MILGDLRIDAGGGHRVVETVFVECATGYRTTGPQPLRPVGETEWVVQRAAKSALSPGARIAGIVGHARLGLGEAVEDVLAARRSGRGRAISRYP